MTVDIEKMTDRVTKKRVTDLQISALANFLGQRIVQFYNCIVRCDIFFVSPLNFRVKFDALQRTNTIQRTRHFERQYHC